MMKIIFVTIDFVIEPLGIMYLSSALKKAGHQVHIIKTVYKGYERYALMDQSHHPDEVVEYEDTVADAINRAAPDILAYSTTTGMHSYYLRLNRKIRQKVRAMSVFGGPHPTFFPEVLNDEYVDAVCIGEGEESFVEFVDTLASGRSARAVRNFWTKENSQIHKNQLRPLIDEIDKIVFPDRELIYRYLSSLSNPIKNFMSSRGCPYNCTYCFNHSYFELYKGNGPRVRLRSVENVLSEIKEVKDNYPLEIVYFQDDIFILSPKWLNIFLPRYKKEIELPFHCHLRAGVFDEQTVYLLKESGCISVTLALESGNDYLRNEILKRNMSKSQIYKAAKLLHRYGIKFRAENMVGLPHESLKMALETLFMNTKCRPAIGWASLYQPYPKTCLGKKCQEEGLFNGSLEAVKPSFFETSILDLPQKREIENLQKLFSITVEFPFLLPLALFLIKLPPNRLFNFIYKKWKNYCYESRLYKTTLCKQKDTGVEKSHISEYKDLPLEFVPCDLCEADETELRFSKGPFKIVKCKRCGLSYMNPRPLEKDICSLYDEDYFLGKGFDNSIHYYQDIQLPSPDMLSEWQGKLREVTKYKRGSRLLDIGCALGFFLEVAQRQGWDVYGIEISEFAHRFSQERLGQERIKKSVRMFSQNSFDLVTMVEVIEHLPSPSEALRQINKILKDDGILFIQTGNIESLKARLTGSRWNYITLPGHIYYFSPETIRRYLEKTGFEILKIVPPSDHEKSRFLSLYSKLSPGGDSSIFYGFLRKIVEMREHMRSEGMKIFVKKVGQNK